jgi:site-specific DNA-methyltransferase (cytosine-N4-specific)
MFNNHEISPYYSKQYRSAFLGDSLELMKHIPNDSINLIVTSPPFALVTPKEYGNKSSDDYIDWFLEFAKEFKRILTPDGSFVVDLGGAYLPKFPIRSIYQYELLVRLVKELKFLVSERYKRHHLPTCFDERYAK